MRWRLSFKIMVGVNNPIIHFMIKRRNFVYIRDLSKKSVTLIARNNITEFSMKKKVSKAGLKYTEVYLTFYLMRGRSLMLTLRTCLKSKEGLKNQLVPLLRILMKRLLQLNWKQKRKLEETTLLLTI